MAEQSVPTALQTIAFRKDFAREYVRKNRFSGYSGKGPSNVICQKLDSSHTIRHPLVTRLQGAGVSGSSMLRGSGESIGLYNWDTVPTYYRHAVEFNKEDYEKTNLNLMTEARPLLLEWAMNETRIRQVNAMGAHYNGTTYAAMQDAAWTEAIADAWLVANSDRVIFGDTEYTAMTDHSAGLATIDATASQFTYARADDMRRLAEDADPHIHPIQTSEQGEVFVFFAGSHTFNALKASLLTVNTGADVRGMKITSGGNIIARDGDLYYNGMIFRKVPEITTQFSVVGAPLYDTGAGAAVIVEPVFCCGTQALMHGMGQAPDIIVDRDYDFKFRPAVAVELKEDIKKTFFNSIQHGMVTGYFAGESA
jgi:hypothetical protein